MASWKAQTRQAPLRPPHLRPPISGPQAGFAARFGGKFGKSADMEKRLALPRLFMRQTRPRPVPVAILSFLIGVLIALKTVLVIQQYSILKELAAL